MSSRADRDGGTLRGEPAARKGTNRGECRRVKTVPTSFGQAARACEPTSRATARDAAHWSLARSGIDLPRGRHSVFESANDGQLHALLSHLQYHSFLARDLDRLAWPVRQDRPRQRRHVGNRAA